LDRSAVTTNTPPSSHEPELPLLWVKIRDEQRPDWSTTPDDLAWLLEAVQDRMNLRYATATRTLDEISSDSTRNPVLFLTGYYHFQFTPPQRATLRRFLLSGGMIVFDAGLGSSPFYNSARRELRLLFPDVSLQRLRSDHPVYHAYYDLERVMYCPGVRQAGYTDEAPWLDGLTVSCRTVALISRWGLAAGWEGKQDDTFRTYTAEDALRLGLNLTAYALAARGWVKHATPPAVFPKPRSLRGEQDVRGAGDS
jgi:hypothetical protein